MPRKCLMLMLRASTACGEVSNQTKQQLERKGLGDMSYNPKRDAPEVLDVHVTRQHRLRRDVKPDVK